MCKNETELVSFASFQNEKFLEIKSPQYISFFKSGLLMYFLISRDVPKGWKDKLSSQAHNSWMLSRSKWQGIDLFCSLV